MVDRDKHWTIKPMAQSMSLLAKPRFLAPRSRNASAKKTLDPVKPPVFGDFCSAFAVGPVWVIVELGDFGGQLEPIRIEVRGYASLGDRQAYPITAGTLRRIQPGRLIGQARDQRAGLLQTLMARASREAPNRKRVAKLQKERQRVAKAARAARSTKSTSGPRRREETDMFRQFLDKYPTKSTSPNVDVGKLLGISRWTAAKYAARARELGLNL
jgi:hypothetical protein